MFDWIWGGPYIHELFDSGSLAQLVEHFTFNEGVDGSNPSRATNFLTK